MKRYISMQRRKSDGGPVQREVPEIDAFLEQIDKVCRQHNMTISHEDFHGGFLIENYDESNINWLKNAADDREEKT